MMKPSLTSPSGATAKRVLVKTPALPGEMYRSLLVLVVTAPVALVTLEEALLWMVSSMGPTATLPPSAALIGP